MLSLSDDSAWDRVQAIQRPHHASQRAAKEEAEPVPESVLRNRITQRQYLRRKKVLPTWTPIKHALTCCVWPARIGPLRVA